jgi:hypothetical protein
VNAQEKAVFKGMRHIASVVKGVELVLGDYKKAAYLHDRNANVTIGIEYGKSVLGGQDGVDHFMGLLGYQGQVERVLFDPEKMRYVITRGWTCKVWPVENEEDTEVTALAEATATKGTAAMMMLAVAAKEHRRKSTVMYRAGRYLRGKK